jgi:hypothetical protein
MRAVIGGLFVLSLSLCVTACESASEDGNGAGSAQDVAAANDNGAASSDGTSNNTGSPGTCKTNEDCADQADGICMQAICDVSSGSCLVGNRPDGTPCDNGDVCTASNQCQAGACNEGAPAPPNCGGKECGTDDCGYECGTCDSGAPCLENGTCDMEGLPSCEDLDYEGCCDQSGALFWCDAGALSSIDCGANDNTCGWGVDAGYYDCGQTGAEASGTFPLECPWEDCPENPCDGLECGVVCGEDCGSCGDEAFCGGDNQCVACSCEGKTCGEDGCGNSCGECGEGDVCEEEQCIPNPCGTITFEGCCDGSSAIWCQDGAIQELDCATADPDAGPMECGWLVEQAYYYCGGSGEDPSGTNALACPAPPEPPVDEDPKPDAGMGDAMNQDGGAPDVGPEKDVPDKDVPDKDVPDKDVPDKDVPDKDVPDKDVPDKDVPDKDVPDKDVPDEDVPDKDVPDKDVPDEDVPDEDVPDEDVPDKDVPDKDAVDKDAPDEAAPDKDVPDKDAADKDA